MTVHGERKNVLCMIGLHKPEKYTVIEFYGKRFRRCFRCGKLLDTIRQ